jgi:glycine dehydrogenase
MTRPATSWPVDNVYGDRNLVCTCPPMANYMEAAE